MPTIPCPDCNHTVSSLALTCPDCGRPLHAAPPVTVADINIRFWSLVKLLVNIAFAAIPAMVITIFVAFGISAVATGVISGLSKTSAPSHYESPSSYTTIINRRESSSRQPYESCESSMECLGLARCDEVRKVCLPIK